MKVVVSENSAVERTLEVQVESGRVQQAYDKQMQDIIRNVTIPGFRKGKAPRKVAERYANKEQLKRNIFEEVGVPAYQQALQQQNLAPISQPSVELVQLEPGKDLIFKATFEVRPEIEIETSEYHGLEVALDQTEVADNDVNQVLEDLRKKAERTVSVDEDRPLAKGDVALVDFTSRLHDRPIDNGSAENFQLDVNDELFVKGFADNLVGMRVDEKKTFTFDFPHEYGNKDLAGQTVTFDFHLRAVKKRELPELDDDLAREVSRFATLNELRASVRERLERNLQHEVGNRALEQLARKKEMPVPRAYVHQMIHFMLENQARQLAQIGIQMDQFLKARNTSVESLVAEMHPQADLMARAEMISDAIIRRENVEVKDDQLDAEVARFAEASNQEFETVKRALVERKELESFRRDVMRRRVLELLAQHAKVTKAAEASETAESGAVEAAEPKENAKAPAPKEKAAAKAGGGGKKKSAKKSEEG